jgi:hypothetical protein
MPGALSTPIKLSTHMRWPQTKTIALGRELRRSDAVTRRTLRPESQRAISCRLPLLDMRR